MSSTTSPPSAGAAPWSQPLQSHIASLGKSPEFYLATIAPTSTTPTPAAPSPNPTSTLQPSSSSSTATTSASTSPIGFLPRLRTCIYRGMWSQLPENHHNNAPRNPDVYESDMIAFTTDARMQKVGELFATSAGKAADESQTKGSGGGGPCEALFWVAEEKTQWRVRGRGYVVGNDIEATRGDKPGEVSSGVRVVKSEVGGGMRVKKGMERKEGEWSWGKELTGHWGNMSPGMRGAWRNPPPGTPSANGGAEGEHRLGQKVEDLEDPVGRENFRVVVVKPEEVERLFLGEPEESRRWLYTVREGGEWKEEELWP